MYERLKLELAARRRRRRGGGGGGEREDDEDELSAVELVCASAVAKMVASSVTYPHEAGRGDAS